MRVALLAAMACLFAASARAAAPQALRLGAAAARAGSKRGSVMAAFAAPAGSLGSTFSGHKVSHGGSGRAPLALAARLAVLRPLRLHVPAGVRMSATAAEEGTKPQDGAPRTHFIANMIKDDLSSGKHKSVTTRFPPEPNGYLHIGHAKSICLNFGVAKEFGGVTNMRFDDTNPVKEDKEYVDSILADVRWLASGSVDGPDPWDGAIRHASDYFEVLYECAEYLIKEGKAYVEELSAEEMREYRGTLTQPGKNSPYRDRPVEENLEMFRKMRAGAYEEGACCLRAKIDMASPNINMRDPAIYRIRKAAHVMTGDAWCIYPMYDYAHCISDALERITHSLCTLEFEDHRPLYDWVLDQLEGSGLVPCHPQQTEFSRLNLQYTVLSKRKLIQLVEEKHVNGWNDPRMPTISGIRRRGYTPEALKLFCERIGISKAENNIDMSVLEDCAREVLEDTSPRAFAVLDPIKLTITNWPEGKVEMFEADAHPKRPELGKREIPFSGSVMIDSEDFSENPPSGYNRLVPGGEVRLKFAYVVTCQEIIKDKSGKVTEIKVTYDPETRAGNTPEGQKRVKGIIQWVSEAHGVPCEVRLYDRLFSTPAPGKDQPDGNFLLDINKDSVKIIKGLAEPSIAGIEKGKHMQFERIGYFFTDPEDSTPQKPVFNRVVTLRDNWNAKAAPPARMEKGQKGGGAAPVPAQGGGGDAVAQADIEPVLRLDMRVGKILSAEKHPDADSLYVEQIDVGDPDGPRTVVSGLANYIPLEEMAGKTCVVLCNLKPAKMRGIESQGMVLCASDNDAGKVELMTPPEGAKIGERIKVEGMGDPQPDDVLKSKTQQKVWPTVAPDLKTDGEGRGQYKGAMLTTSAGPLSSGLKGKPIS